MLVAFFDCFLLYLPEQYLLLTPELTTLGESPGSVLQARDLMFYVSAADTNSVFIIAKQGFRRLNNLSNNSYYFPHSFKDFIKYYVLYLLFLNVQVFC